MLKQVYSSHHVQFLKSHDRHILRQKLQPAPLTSQGQSSAPNTIYAYNRTRTHQKEISDGGYMEDPLNEDADLNLIPLVNTDIVPVEDTAQPIHRSAIQSQARDNTAWTKPNLSPHHNLLHF